MKQENLFSRIYPHLVVFGIFILLVLVYFRPAVLEKKSIRQQDILQYQGSAKEISDYRVETGEEALWTNSMFGGMPAYLISTLHYGELIHKAANKFFGFFPHPSGILLIHMVSFYILLLSFGLRPSYAAIGAIAYAFATFTMVSLEAGHNNKVKAMGYAPLVLAGVVQVFRNNNYLGGFVLAAIAVALNLGSNHYQITYYLAFILAIYAISEGIYAIREKQVSTFLKKSGVLIAAAIFGLATNAGSFLTTYEYTQYSSRGKSELTTKTNPNVTPDGGLERDYAFNWSYGIKESLTVLIPNYYGGPTVGKLDTKSEVFQAMVNGGVQRNQALQYIEQMPLYWGDQPATGGPTYFGAIICFLFVLGLFILEPKVKYWLLAVTILSFMLAWGKNFEVFNNLMFDYFPAYNKFRAVTMTLFIANLTFVLMGLLALYKLFHVDFSKDVRKNLFISFGITAGLCLVLYLFAGARDYSLAKDIQVFGEKNTWLIDALEEDRKSLFQRDALRSFILITLAFGAIYLAGIKKIGQNVAVVIVGILILGDLWFVDRRFVNDESFERKVVETHFTPTEADQAILQDKTLNYRVLNLKDPFNDARTSYFHKSLGGYHGAKMKRYQDLIEYHLGPEINVLISNARQNNFDFSDLDVLNMLNTRYFIFGEEKNAILKNNSTFGNAWFVNEVKTVNSPDGELETLSTIKTRTTAIIDKSKFNFSDKTYSVDSSANIRLIEYKPPYLKYESHNSNPGFAVFSEIYYPEGWKAFIDGKETEFVRVNYILRGMEIPAGKHIIEFKFEPSSYKLGNSVALVSSLILIGCLGAIMFFEFKKNKKSDEEA